MFLFIVQNRSLLTEQPFLPDVLPSLCDTFVSKKIIATPMKIGFLGLGLIGSGAVDSLLRSGHEVTIWNRTASKVVVIQLLSSYPLCLLSCCSFELKMMSSFLQTVFLFWLIWPSVADQKFMNQFNLKFLFLFIARYNSICTLVCNMCVNVYLVLYAIWSMSLGAMQAWELENRPDPFSSIKCTQTRLMFSFAWIG